MPFEKFFQRTNGKKIEATSNQTQCPSRLNWLIRSITKIKYTINWRGTTHFHSENVNRPGCRNVSQCQQQSYSGLRSTGRSYSTYLWSVLSFDRINLFNMAILLSMESLCLCAIHVSMSQLNFFFFTSVKLLLNRFFFCTLAFSRRFLQAHECFCSRKRHVENELGESKGGGGDCYFCSSQSSSVIKSKMATTTIRT